MSEPIKIIDILVSKNYFGEWKHLSIVVDRMPERVYEKFGTRLTSHDSGFYDFLNIAPGSRDAFGGREFTLNMADGSTFECKGQVWAVGPHEGCEPVLSLGIATLEKLHECYVFSAASVSKALVEAWLKNNKPTYNHRKYDKRETVEWGIEIAQSRPDSLKNFVSAARARKLRRRGATVFRTPDGRRYWSQWLERHKADIAQRKREAEDAALSM